MGRLIWTSTLYCFVCILVIGQQDIGAEEAGWIPTPGSLDLQSDDISQRQTLFQTLAEIPGTQGLLPRKKRDVLLSSGVRLCSQETVQQVINNHLKYYQLRACQETVWEAFKIFWDRLPNQKEYQSWMSQCQAGNVSIQEIGSAFSQSEEHLVLVNKRLAHSGLQSETPTTSVCSPQDSSKELDSGSPGDESPLEAIEVATAPIPVEVVSVSVMEATIEAPVVTDQETEITNEIELEAALPTRPLVEQKVELTLLLSGEPWSEELSDLTSSEHQRLTQQFTEKISSALENLTEFKSVLVLDVRPQMDPSSGDKAVLVEYIVFLQTSGDEISSETLDFINLQSNMVEGSYSDSEGPTVLYTITDLKAYVTEPLNVETSSEEAPMELPDRKDDILAPEKTLKNFTFDGLLFDPTKLEEIVIGENDVIILDEHTPAPIDQTSSSFSDDTEDKNSPTIKTPAVDSETVGWFSDSTEVADVIMDDSDPSSGSGAGEDDWLLVPALPVETPFEEPTEKTEDDDDVLIDVDTPLEKDIEFSTITTIIEEDQILPGETPELITVDAGEDTEISGGGDVTPAEPPVRTEEDEVPEVPDLEKDIISPAEGEKPEENKEKETDPIETDVTVITKMEPEEAEEENADITAVAENGKDAVLTDVSAVQFSEEDLTGDEILLVNIEPAGPTSSTSLSPEKDSPFTLITIITPGEVESAPALPSEIINTSLDYNVIYHGEDEGSGVSVIQGDDVNKTSVAMPTNPGRALMVFFSLRVTNMMFSEDLFNKSSPEYKALEQRFLELLVPYLQSNLSNFENLEILNFRNGSIVVNSRMKFGKPVPNDVNTAVYLILEDFCNTAYQTMNLAIDKYSLDIESGDQADACKFQACNEFAECTVNRWSGEAECVCNAGYFSVDGLPCQSICDLQSDFCLNDGKCDIIPGQGAICRCRVGENWWYRGEHCEEFVSEPLVVGIAIASVAGFLLVASGVIFFLARTLRDQYDKDESEDPIRRGDSIPSLDRATKYNPMYESDITTGYSHYYRRYPDPPIHSSGSAEASTDFSSEEVRHIYENSELTKEEIQDRIRILELYAKDRQFADFLRHHQITMDNRRESSST